MISRPMIDIEDGVFTAGELERTMDWGNEGDDVVLGLNREGSMRVPSSMRCSVINKFK